MSIELERRCWAEINLDHLRNNFTILQNAAHGAAIIAVVKANAYGHGDIAVAKTLEEAGAGYFAVANLTEAVRLRQAGISGQILIMGITPPEKAMALAMHSVTQCVFSADYARQLSHHAAQTGVTIPIHIKVDTGLGRLGFATGESHAGVVQEIAAVCALPNLVAEGLFTHFAVSGERTPAAKDFTQQQFTHFVMVREALAAQGIRFAMAHCSNSGGFITRPDFVMDAVRPGILLYGLTPEDGVTLPGLQPVLELKAVVAMVKYINPGDSISYGRTFVAEQPMRVATIAAGYADGYRRTLSGQGVVSIQGQRAKVLGRVCMDQFVVDVTPIPEVQAGDVATLYGGRGADTLNTAAAKCDTISYELLCNIGGRVPRVSLQNGQEAAVTNYLEASL